MITDKRLPEGVHFLQLTVPKMYELWDKLKDFAILYSDSNRGDEFGFYKKLLDRDTIIFELEGGIMIMDNLVPNEHAQVHVSFWDCKFSEKASLMQATLAWCFEVWQLNRVEALIPAFAKALSRLMVKRLGFVLEGRLRERLLYQGQFKDVLVYSLLRKEFIDG